MTLGQGQIFNFSYRFLYQTLCVFSQIKDRKHIERNFHFVAWVMPQGWDFGVLKGQLWPAFSAIGIGEHYFKCF